MLNSIKHGLKIKLLSQQLPVISGLDEAGCNAVETPAYAPDIDESEFDEILVKAPKADTVSALRPKYQ